LNPGAAVYISNWGLVAGEFAARYQDAQLAQRARAAHTRATSLAPDFWLYWRSSGFTELMLGNPADAQQKLQRAVGLWDLDTPTQIALGDASAQIADFAAARTAYHKALQQAGPNTHIQQALDAIGD
jgi:tetratricopeptide (TPR) repeat protein